MESSCIHKYINLFFLSFLSFLFQTSWVAGEVGEGGMAVVKNFINE